MNDQGSKLTILMYHYVRNISNSKHPNIKGLSIDEFRGQLKYVLMHYNVISMQDLIASVKKEATLPNNPILLTFDDGYKDHYDNVFPILKELNIQGSFFPSVNNILQDKVLNANKIHFILDKVDDIQLMLDDIYSIMDDLRSVYSLNSNEYYYKKLAKKGRYDSEEVVFTKRLLQRELPEQARNIILDKLFDRYVQVDEAEFSRELYLNVDQLKHMLEEGMFIGSHGYGHFWLDCLTRDRQEEEIDLSLKFLADIGCDLTDWVMCYPFGAYNESLISVIKSRGCCLALTIKPDIADLSRYSPYELPRLDTNDLPKSASSKPNRWTSKSI